MLIFLLSFLVALLFYYFMLRRLPPAFGSKAGSSESAVDGGLFRKWLTIGGPIDLILIAAVFIAALIALAYLMFYMMYREVIHPFGFRDFLHSEFAAQIFLGGSAGFTVGRIIDLSYFADASEEEERRKLIERRRRFYISGLVALVAASLLTASGNTLTGLLSRIQVLKTPFAEIQVAGTDAGADSQQVAPTVISAVTSSDNVRVALGLLARFHRILETDNRYAENLVVDGQPAINSDYIPPAANAVFYRKTVAPIMSCLLPVYIVDRDRAFVSGLLRPVVQDLRAVAHRGGMGGAPLQVDLSDDISAILDTLQQVSETRTGTTAVPLSPEVSIELDRYCRPERFQQLKTLIFGADGELEGEADMDRVSAMLASLRPDRRPYLTLFLAYVLMATDSEVAAVAEIDRWRREHEPPEKPGNAVERWHRFRLNRDLISLLSGMGATSETPDLTLLLAELSNDTLDDIDKLAGRTDWTELYGDSSACKVLSLDRSDDESYEDFLFRHHVGHSNLYAYYGARTFSQTNQHVKEVMDAAERIFDFSIDCATSHEPNYKILENLETASSVFVAYARDLPGAQYRSYEVSRLLDMASNGYGSCLLALENRRQERLDVISDEGLFIGSRIDSSQPHLFDRCLTGAAELERVARMRRRGL